MANAIASQHVAPRVDGYNVTFENAEETFCPPDSMPDIQAYYSDMSIYCMALLSIGGVAMLVVVVLWIDALHNLLRRAPGAIRTHSAFVLSVYPVVSVASFIALCIPRAQLLSEAVTQGAFMIAAYRLFKLLIGYCGGEEGLLRSTKDLNVLVDMRAPPCCCWPCCRISPVPATEQRIEFLRYLVLQLPIVQGLVYIVLLVMWAEEESLYQVNYMFLQPIVVTSILFGIWGITSTLKLVSHLLLDHRLTAKFLVLQLVLIFAKLQGIAVRIANWQGALPCRPTIPPSVYANLIYNSLMLLEMVLLAAWARSIYRIPILTESEASSTDKNCNVEGVRHQVPALQTISGGVTNKREAGLDNQAFKEGGADKSEHL